MSIQERLPSATTEGSVTSAQGFLADATYAGIKPRVLGDLDLGLLYSERPATAAAVFTTNWVQASHIHVTREHLSRGRAQAVIVNSGNANACTGPQGLADARQTCALTAERLGLRAEEVLVASTGVIGRPLPMDRLQRALPRLAPRRDGGPDFARAIMTTDTVPKTALAHFAAGGRRYTLGGCAKGAGMIHPNMATMLAFLTTDAPLPPGLLRTALRSAADESFNMITVDGDTSTNDTVLLLANGAVGGEPLTPGSSGAREFRRALRAVCRELARAIARDGEGATKLLEVRVEGARTRGEARVAARTVVGSTLVKAAMSRGDPNWGRVLAALGRSGAQMSEKYTRLWIGGVLLYDRGTPRPADPAPLKAALAGPEVALRLHLGCGAGVATAWGCDLTEEYVRLNSEYVT